MIRKIFLTAFISLSICNTNPAIALNQYEKQAIYLGSETEQKQFTDLMESIIEYHEEKTGVDYDSKPGLLFDNEMDYNDVARYDVEKEIIYLHPRYKTYDISFIINDVDKELGKTEEEIKARELREILSHELAHFLTDRYIAKYVPDSWLKDYFDKSLEPGLDNIDVYLVTEGIGEYFGKLFDEGGAVFASDRWNDNHHIEDFRSSNWLTWLLYMGGRDIVEPVLDISAHNGLIWLLNNELVINPPDLSNVPEYKEKSIKK